MSPLDATNGSYGRTPASGAHRKLRNEVINNVPPMGTTGCRFSKSFMFGLSLFPVAIQRRDSNCLVDRSRSLRCRDCQCAKWMWDHCSRIQTNDSKGVEKQRNVFFKQNDRIQLGPTQIKNGDGN